MVPEWNKKKQTQTQIYMQIYLQLCTQYKANPHHYFFFCLGPCRKCLNILCCILLFLFYTSYYFSFFLFIWTKTCAICLNIMVKKLTHTFSQKEIPQSNIHDILEMSWIVFQSHSTLLTQQHCEQKKSPQSLYLV